MTIDRRGFMLGSGAAAIGGALRPLAAVTAATLAAGTVPALAVAGEPVLALGIVGWDDGDAASAWIALDGQWRCGWH